MNCRSSQKLCLGLSGGLAGVVVCFLVAMYLVRRQSKVYISDVVSSTGTTYAMGVTLALITAAVVIGLEVKYRVLLHRPAIASSVLFGVSLIVAICVTNRRQKWVHWAFTASILVWMIVSASLWTHSGWVRGAPVRSAMVAVVVVMGLAALGVTLVFALRGSSAWLAAMEWMCLVLFLVLLVLSCLGSRSLCPRQIDGKSEGRSDKT